MDDYIKLIIFNIIIISLPFLFKKNIVLFYVFLLIFLLMFILTYMMILKNKLIEGNYQEELFESLDSVDSNKLLLRLPLDKISLILETMLEKLSGSKIENQNKCKGEFIINKLTNKTCGDGFNERVYKILDPGDGDCLHSELYKEKTPLKFCGYGEKCEKDLDCKSNRCNDGLCDFELDCSETMLSGCKYDSCLALNNDLDKDLYFWSDNKCNANPCNKNDFKMCDEGGCNDLSYRFKYDKETKQCNEIINGSGESTTEPESMNEIYQRYTEEGGHDEICGGPNTGVESCDIGSDLQPRYYCADGYWNGEGEERGSKETCISCPDHSHGNNCASCVANAKDESGECVCKVGYSGHMCETDACKDYCENNGTCVRGVPSPTCECINGYTGPKCDTPPDLCLYPDTINCGVHGSCSSGLCRCVDGYTGALCDTPPDPCLYPSPTALCGVHGSCSSGLCKCVNGYSGPKCDTPPDPCLYPDTIDCGDNGRCDDGFCACGDGYTGALCDTPPDPCLYPDTINCGVHGSCSSGLCRCVDGYSGPKCETAPDPCLYPSTTALCGDYGSCHNGVCECYPGHTGEKCEILLHWEDFDSWDRECDTSCAHEEWELADDHSTNVRTRVYRCEDDNGGVFTGMCEGPSPSEVLACAPRSRCNQTAAVERQFASMLGPNLARSAGQQGSQQSDDHYLYAAQEYYGGR
jgi:hypothetical protein